MEPTTVMAGATLLCVLLLLWLEARRGAGETEASVALAARLGTLELLAAGATGQQKADAAQLRDELARTLALHQQATQQGLSDQRRALADLQRLLADQLTKTAADGREEDRRTAEAFALQIRERLGEMKTALDGLTQSLRTEAQAGRQTLETKMTELQASNEQRLEQMRQTVDEKLHATLEQRLGESFKLVGERLEAVQKGLGEMKSLADGVGDLKRVMTNVKTRGTFGEVRLRALIEDVLRPGEYVENWAPRGSGERVEFAVRLPGLVEGAEIHLPIDSKFPVEDWQRLVDAQERADADAVQFHARALEERVKGCARDIRDKYLEAGVTTDFGLLFLPSEGLYAEVLRRPGLVEKLQQELRVTVAGPTTLAALLTSIRMGFRAVAIQRRSSDIGALLGAVKTEFGKFGGVIEAVGRKLRSAQDELEQVGVRTRAIHRKLRDVEALPSEASARLLTDGRDSDDGEGSAQDDEPPRAVGSVS
jgi:DNA recombination protein RmuC